MIHNDNANRNANANDSDHQSGYGRRALFSRATVAISGTAAATWVGAAAMPAFAAGSSFVPIRPFRVYDSRQDPQGISIGSDQLWTVDTFSDATGQRKIAAAQAISYTVTVVAGSPQGFLTLMPGNDTQRPAYSTVNWDRAYQVIANSSVVQVTQETIEGQPVHGALNIYCGGGGTCAFIVDVTGYFTR